MRIERINENSIRCTLTSFDLSVRNLNLRELAYGSDKARKLFEEMMNKANNEVGFSVDNTPIMIEAIPMSGDSIQLIISKVANPEELDARFSRFTQNPAMKREAEHWISKLASALLEGADGFAEQLKAASGATAGISAKEAQTGDAKADAPAPDELKPEDFRVFAFEELDTVIQTARIINAYSGSSTLYKSPSDGHYCLVIGMSEADKDGFARACNVASEYGRMVRTVQDTLSYYNEHYKLISADAITKLGQL